MFSLIVAIDSKNGIGKDRTLPWKCPNDLNYFKKITSEVPIESTKQNVVVMGKNTWDSIPERFRPLKDRINVVLSRTVEETTPAEMDLENVIFFNSIDKVFSFVEEYKKKINKTFIIGGNSIYDSFLKTKQISTLYISKIKGDFDCDTFFPIKYLEWYRKVYSEHDYSKDLNVQFERYEYINKDEENYLSLLKNIMETGDIRQDRTKIGTKSKFGCVLKWDLTDGTMPILTTKRTFFRGIAEELFWFLSGSTDARKLQERGVGIWNGNSSREFLDSRGLHHLEAGDIGAGYGFQLRHFGAEYTNCNADYAGKGFDQLQYVVDTIRIDPHSRRILFSYWNPAAMDTTSLMPCHLMYQFYINTDRKTISCNLYQRSSDFFLANSFNVVSAVILTHMIGKLTGYTPDKLNHMMGDTHIYQNHITQCETQLSRIPTCFPKFRINPKNEIKTITDFTIEDLELICYFPQAGIKAPMAV
jgi:dihydrofolate reductase/thymidylate synthase